MIHTHHFRLMVALMIMELPMMAMSMSKKDINHMRDEIYVVLIGLNDNTEKWTQHGMRYLRNHANELPRLSFGQLRCSSEIQKQLLKYLVIKKEKALLSTFIDMYQRTHHHNREGINFIYKLESKDGRRKQIIEYTLLDVALTAYCQALEKKEAGQAESNILTLLVDQGAEFKLYRDCDHNDE